MKILGLLGSFGFLTAMLYIRRQVKARVRQRENSSSVASWHPVEQEPSFFDGGRQQRVEQAYAEAGKTRADFSILVEFARDRGYFKPSVVAEWEWVHDEAESGPPYMVEHLAGHWFGADGEANAERGIEDFVELVAPAMAQVGLPIEQVAVDYSNDALLCRLTCNGRTTEVFRTEDWPSRAWALATERPLSLLNLLLEEANNSHRWYGRYVGGNEGTVVLLPQDLGNLAVSHSLELVSFPATTHGVPTRN